jgi:hypothetical protein
MINECELLTLTKMFGELDAMRANNWYNDFFSKRYTHNESKFDICLMYECCWIGNTEFDVKEICEDVFEFSVN